MSTSTGASERYLEVSEAAAYVHLSVSAFRAVRARGDGPPAIKVSRKKLLFDPGDLDRWLVSRKDAR